MKTNFNLKDIIEAKNINKVASVATYKDKLKSSLDSGKANFRFGEVLESLMRNADFREEFTYSFNKHMGFGSKGVNFDVTATTLDNLEDEIALPTMEALIRDTGLLSRFNVVTMSEKKVLKMNDFGEEKDAENLAEQATGTEADVVWRKGDALTPETKVQASTVMTELAIYDLDPSEMGKIMARLVRRVQYKLIDNALNAGSGVANGTARTLGTIRGINNNYGVNGTGDATNFIGAITYADKAAADALLPIPSADSYDLAVKIKRALLPSNLLDVDEADYIYIMNRASWGAISTILDSNGRYKSDTAFNPTTNKPVKLIDGAEVYISPAAAANKVFLIPPSMYTLTILGGIRSLTDSGIVELKEGNITYVTRTYADGSMNYGHKYKVDTAATIGTTAVDNADQNAFRYFSLT